MTPHFVKSFCESFLCGSIISPKTNPQNQPQNNVSDSEWLNKREEREIITTYTNQGVTPHFVDNFVDVFL